MNKIFHESTRLESGCRKSLRRGTLSNRVYSFIDSGWAYLLIQIPFIMLYSVIIDYTKLTFIKMDEWIGFCIYIGGLSIAQLALWSAWWYYFPEEENYEDFLK